MNTQVLTIEQGTEAWLKARLGVLTASCAHDLMPNKTNGKRKASWDSYMIQLISEVCTGKGEEINAKALEWGRVNEVSARAAYEFEANEMILPGGFIYNLDKRVGASPDGLVKGKNKGLELKCPFSSQTHIDFILNGAIKDAYVTQVQWSMWVTGFDEWAFASFDPRMKNRMVHIEVIKRDEEMMKMFNELAPKFIKEMDEKLKELGFVYGQQWS